MPSSSHYAIMEFVNTSFLFGPKSAYYQAVIGSELTSFKGMQVAACGGGASYSPRKDQASSVSADTPVSMVTVS